jgi:hypothetical protein
MAWAANAHALRSAVHHGQPSGRQREQLRLKILVQLIFLE